MKKIIILIVSCLINATLWAESSNSLSISSNNSENIYKKDAVNDESTQENIASPATIDSNIDTTVATADSSPIASDTSYTAPDGVTYGLEKGPMGDMGGDTGVNLAPKQPNVYDDRAYVQLHKSSSTNTPFKRPEIEVSILVGGSGSYIPVNESLIDTRGAAFTPPAKYKFHLSGEGFSGGASLGANWRRGNHTFGTVMTGYLDSHTLKNYDHKDDVYSHDISPSMSFLDRSYTLEFAAKAGHYFGDLHLYGKLGFMCSAFQYKYRNTDVDRRKNITAWGGVAGIGLQKPISLPVLNDTRIGIEYNYQLYETLTPVVKYTNRIDTAKLRPRYHNGYITLSKTF